MTKLTDFGAFIEIEEGIEGLAHISELSWVRKVKHPKEVLKVGDVVETKILGYDIQQGKLSLGLKQVLPNPWDDIDQRYPVGMRLTRRVKTSPASRLSSRSRRASTACCTSTTCPGPRRSAAPFVRAKVDDEVEVMVIGIDKERGKVQLGVKQLSEDPWESIARAYPRGSVIDGEVTNITDFGFFVKVQGGIEGLIHKANVFDPALETLEAAMAKYKVGDTVQAVVIECSPSKQKLSPLPAGLQRARSSARRWTSTSTTSPARRQVTLADLLKDKIKG